MLRKLFAAFSALLVFIGAAAWAQDETTPTWKLREREDISDVWNRVTLGLLVPRRAIMLVYSTTVR